jgi:hypothetical protein
VVIGGDLKFPMEAYEIWGPTTHMDCLSRYFIRKMEATDLLDIKLAKLTPTWKIKRTREDRIAKRLGHFLTFEGFLENVIQVRQWVALEGDSDHNLNLLEVSLS